MKSEKIIAKMYGLDELEKIEERYEPKDTNIVQAAKFLNLALKKGSTTKEKYQIILSIIVQGMMPAFRTPKAIFQFMRFVATNIAKGESFHDNKEVLDSLKLK